MALSRCDLSVIEGDARIADHHINDALGMSRVREVRALIRRHEEELETYGSIFAANSRENTRGRPTVTYYLNEEQATLVCMFARTPRAAEARRQIISVFTAWRRGQLEVHAALLPPRLDPFGGSSRSPCQGEPGAAGTGEYGQPGRAGDASAHLDERAAPGLVGECRITRIPDRDASTGDDQGGDSGGQGRWPEAAISASGVHRFWARLDRLRQNKPAFDRPQLALVASRPEVA